MQDDGFADLGYFFTLTNLELLILGALLGALGAAYNQAVVRWLDLFAWFKGIPVTLRATFVGGTVGLVAWFEPRLAGGGERIVQQVLDGHFTGGVAKVLVQ